MCLGIISVLGMVRRGALEEGHKRLACGLIQEECVYPGQEQPRIPQGEKGKARPVTDG